MPHRPHLFASVCLLCCGALPPLLAAEELVLTLDPSQTQIRWTLGATLHTVEGTFQLKRGSLRFDPARATVSGEIAVSLTSGESGNSSRDHKMQKEVLESGKFPEAVFVPDRVTGRIPGDGESSIQVHGTFRIHGEEHELTLDFAVAAKGGQITAATSFVVPYVKWGMKDPSNFILKVEDKVKLDIKTSARVQAKP